MRARKVEIKLRRNDTEPDPDEQHRYGPRIDGLLDDLAGGAGRIDRTVRPFPNARAVSTRARLELHEDGPILQTALEHLPELLNAAASLLTPLVRALPIAQALPARLDAAFGAIGRLRVDTYTPHTTPGGGRSMQ